MTDESTIYLIYVIDNLFDCYDKQQRKKLQVNDYKTVLYNTQLIKYKSDTNWESENTIYAVEMNYNHSLAEYNVCVENTNTAYSAFLTELNNVCNYIKTQKAIEILNIAIKHIKNNIIYVDNTLCDDYYKYILERIYTKRNYLLQFNDRSYMKD